MSHDRLGPRIEEIEAQVQALLAEAEAIDAAEDEAFGADRRGDEVPAEHARRDNRLAKMRAAKEAIEAAEAAAARAKPEGRA